MRTNVAQTSMEAFWSIKPELSERQAVVLAAIRARGPICNYDLVAVVGRPVNQITPRTLELREKGLVVEAYRDKHQVTGKTVIYWQAVKS